jgi:hypothetical protein
MLLAQTPLWLFLITPPILLTWIILTFVAAPRVHGLGNGLFAFIACYIATFRAVGVAGFRTMAESARHARPPASAWTPPEKPDYGPSWRVR